jgi:hypothetical protein
LSRKCGIFNVSQPYRLPRPVAGIALLTRLYLISNLMYSVAVVLLNDFGRRTNDVTVI